MHWRAAVYIGIFIVSVQWLIDLDPRIAQMNEESAGWVHWVAGAYTVLWLFFTTWFNYAVHWYAQPATV
jgi:hypothetical protein